MKKPILIIAGVVVLMAVVGGIIAIMTQPQSSNNSSNTSSQGDSTTQPQQTSNETNKVTIKDMDYSPTRIKVKKGTTVTWTNQDSVGHNVVANDSNNTGGLPTNAPLLNQGETFSFTFNEVGTFAYHCAPHPFMRGAVEVTE